MKALTLIQPWATLIAIGAKRIETRSWETKHRGWIAITASKRFPRECQIMMDREPFTSALAGPEYPFSSDSRDLPRGAVVCLAHLKNCRPMGTCDWPPDWVENLSAQERAFGAYGPGRFGWLFDQVKALKQPVPCKGARGLWDVPTDLAAAIGVQLP